MLEPFIPSVIIVVSVSAAFAAGRLLAIATARISRALTFVGVVVALGCIAFAILFATNGSSRYALLLPAGFALGFFGHGRGRLAPGLFK